jgi:hypothetical protein
MPLRRRIYISMPADEWLSLSQNDLKWGIVDAIERLGFTTEIFTDPRGQPSLAAGKAWSAEAADRVARRCVGAAIIGSPRWVFETKEGRQKLPTEFCHYEGALAFTLGLPMLVVVQTDVLRRVVFDPSYRGYVGRFPEMAGRDWLTTKDFTAPFEYWKQELSRRRDIFLGYCSSSAGTAHNIKRFLQADLGATILDWQVDFAPGRSILQEIGEASARCSKGIFLFTKDDNLLDAGSLEKAAPRDNVVFEAGYFISAKGKDQVLVIKESGAKMPADLGGDIYATLVDRANILPIEDQMRKFVEDMQ